MNSNLLVKTKLKKYSIFIGKNLIKKCSKILYNKLPKVKKIAIIVDQKVPKTIVNLLKLNLKKYHLIVIELKSGEKTKTLNNVNLIINKLLKNNFLRSDCVVALGGGVVGDVSALAANLTKRGIKFINIPSTLLSQVDSSIGGKTGVNSKYGKNLIGTFYQPDIVIIDTNLISSLPRREMICGYAEILKHSLITDEKFFYWLTKNGQKILYKNSKFLNYALLKSCKIKAKIIEKDEHEKKLRMILNFGHSFGHALESIFNYSKKLNHGEAVLLGMMIAAQFSVKNKLLSKKDLSKIQSHYIKLNLPMNLKKYLSNKNLKSFMDYIKKDKKNISNKIQLIMLKKIGKVKIINFNVNKIHNFLKSNI